MKNRQKGVALIELALILPLLLLMMILTFEFGRALYQYNIVTKSIRDAVRYLSIQSPGTHIDETRNMIVYGNTAGTGSPLAPGLETSHVIAPTWQSVGSNPVINTVTITVRGYQFRSIFDNVFGVAIGDFNYNDISASMRAPSS